MIPIILFDTSSSFLMDIQKRLKDEACIRVNASSAQIPELEALLRKHQDVVLVIGPTLKREDVVSIAESVVNEYPQLGIVLISSDLSTDLLRDALRVGIRDVLPTSVTTKQLVPTLERAFEHSRRIRSALTGTKNQSTAKAQGFQEHRAKVITFFSAKGGVGKTFIASNVAVALAQQTKSRVVLVDLDLQFGDVAVMLQLTPERTIYDVISSMERLDADMMEGFLSVHSSGLRALLSPVQPDQSEAISGGDISRIIEVLRETNDYLLIDTSPSFNDHVLAVLDNSDEICLVATLDVPSLKNTKLSIHMMDMLQYPKEKMSLVLNRANSKVRLTPKDVEKAIEMKAVVSIPSDIIVPLSVNKGIPLVMDLPRSAVSRSLLQLVDHLRASPAAGSFELRRRVAN